MGATADVSIDITRGRAIGVTSLYLVGLMWNSMKTPGMSLIHYVQHNRSQRYPRRATTWGITDLKQARPLLRCLAQGVNEHAEVIQGSRIVSDRERTGEELSIEAYEYQQERSLRVCPTKGMVVPDTRPLWCVK